MRNFLLFIPLFSLGIVFGLVSCSTCYECESEVTLEDGQGNVIGTEPNTEEFCTGDKEEVTAREDAGAVCRVQ